MRVGVLVLLAVTACGGPSAPDTSAADFRAALHEREQLEENARRAQVTLDRLERELELASYELNRAEAEEAAATTVDQKAAAAARKVRARAAREKVVGELPRGPRLGDYPLPGKVPVRPR